MKIGESKYGFKFVSEDDLEEYRSKGKRFIHEETGCDLYHIENESEENFFSFIFKTFPLGNKGTAHIIEHSVLAGSECFPLKDPFIELIKSSMYTFLNAMTYPDKTVYPGASTVEADYFNLMKVYGDAVFFPLLKKETFMQEGIRFEEENGNIVPKGIVFNEMKGSYSDHNSVLAEWSYRSLFPDNNYKYDSGGMPDEIRKLTYQEFLDFHKIYYHPSNCRIFLYGSFDTEKQLEFIQNNFLNRFSSPASLPPEIPVQKKINPVSLVRTSHSEDGKGISSITLNWLCGDSTDPVQALEMELLTEILMGTSASPLYLEIVKSDIGGDLAPVSGVDTDLRQIVFSVGIRDTSPGKEKDFEKLIINALEKAVSEGLDRNLVEGAIRTAEFVNREIKGGRPYGLFLMDMACQGWLHGKEPSYSIGFRSFVKTVRERMKNDSRYFEKLIMEKLLKNSHRSIVTVKPDITAAEEKYIPETEPEKFTEDSELFIKYRDSKDSEEDIKKIPVLKKSDIPEKVSTIDSEKGKINSSECYYHDFFTAGIVYADLFYDIRKMDEDLKMYLPLFARALRESGLPGIPFYEVARELALKTGGFFVFPETGKAFDRSINEYIIIRYKAIEERFEDASELIFNILGDADFNDLERLKEIINELTSDFRASILRRGNYVVSLTASGKFSRSLKRQAGWAGADQVLFLSEIDTEDINVLKETALKLKRIQKWIISESSVTAGLTSDKSCFKSSTDILSKYIKNPPAGDFDPVYENEKGPATEKNSYETLLIPTLVNFNASVVKASRSGTEEFIHEKLLSRIIDTGYLWEKVRMENGAYGVGAAVNGMEGIMSFSSYRDPSIQETQEAFKSSLKYIAEGNITADELFKAVLNCIGKEIKPLSPGEKGHVNMRRKLYSLSDEIRQKNRDIMLKAEPEDIVRAAERLYIGFDEAHRCTMCGNETLESSKEYFSEFNLRKTKLPV